MNQRSAVLDDVADRDLVADVRAGSDEAYGVLFERHRDMARRFARSKLANPSDADDVVAEVFASVLATIRRGGGPIDSFAPYLMTSLRHQCQRVGEQRTQQLALVGQQRRCRRLGDRVDDVAAGAGEAEIVRDAFQSLPPKFQDVLWRVEVDEEPYEALASRYRTTAGGVAVLTLRARRALASAYLDRHRPLPQPGRIAGTTCRAVAPQLTELVRGTVGRRRRQQVEAHLAQCESCRRTQAELGRINQHLRTLPIAPLALLGGAASVGTKGGIHSYLATCWTAAAPIVTSGVAAVAVISPVALAADDEGTLSGLAAPADAATEVVEAASSGSEADVQPGGSSGRADVDRRRHDRARCVDDDHQHHHRDDLHRPCGGVQRRAGCGGLHGGSGHRRYWRGGVARSGLTGPGARLPGVTVPGVSTPGLTVPGLTVPGVTVPGVTVPPVTLPPRHRAARDTAAGHHATRHRAARDAAAGHHADRHRAARDTAAGHHTDRHRAARDPPAGHHTDHHPSARDGATHRPTGRGATRPRSARDVAAGHVPRCRPVVLPPVTLPRLRAVSDDTAHRPTGHDTTCRRSTRDVAAGHHASRHPPARGLATGHDASRDAAAGHGAA